MDDKRYKAARKYVHDLKEFYTHLAVYVIVNLFLIIVNVITSPDSWWFYWVSLAWGIGLAIHAYEVFLQERFFGTEWEERKIRELMGEKPKRDRLGYLEADDDETEQLDDEADDIPVPRADDRRRQQGRGR
jgi:hypothetical protein